MTTGDAAAGHAALDARARAILAANDLGGYTIPSKDLYPFQWNWDSAFVALGFAGFDQDRAWREIETLFGAQRADGFVPHIVFWDADTDYFPGPAVWGVPGTPAASGVTQPPVATSVVRWLWERADQPAFRDRLVRLYPKLVAWHRWFRRCRDPQGRGLVVTVHPWETGRDNSPEWDAPFAAVDTAGVGPFQRHDTGLLDPAMRPTKDDYDRYIALVQFGRAHGWDQELIATQGPFRVADVHLTMILLRANRDLLALADMLGQDADAEEIAGDIARAEAGIEELWDEAAGTFCSRDILSGRLSGDVTSASFLAFYAGVGSPGQRRRLLGHLERIAGKVRYLVPSFDPDGEAFDAIRYWRGPVWAVVNYLCAVGLAEAGHDGWADRLRADTHALIAGNDFFEAYCPLTGRGTGGADFSWTAAMWLHWAGA